MKKIDPASAIDRNIFWRERKKGRINAAIKRGGPGEGFSKFFHLPNKQATQLFNPPHPIRNPDTIYLNLGIPSTGRPMFRPFISYAKEYAPDHHSRYFNSYEMDPISPQDVPSLTLTGFSTILPYAKTEILPALGEILSMIFAKFTTIPPGYALKMIKLWDGFQNQNTYDSFLFPHPNDSRRPKELVEHFIFKDSVNNTPVTDIKQDVLDGKDLYLALGFWDGKDLSDTTSRDNDIFVALNEYIDVFKPILLTGEQGKNLISNSAQEILATLTNSLKENQSIVRDKITKNLTYTEAKAYYDLAHPCPQECNR